MSKLLKATAGWKTYASAAAMVAYALYGYYLGGDFNTELFLQACGLVGLRHAVS